MDINEFDATPTLGEFPEALRRYFGLSSLEAIADAANVNGAARLFTCPSFEPIEAMTLVFLDGKVIASRVVSDDDVWEQIACGEESPDDLQLVQRDRELSIPELPTIMQGWEPFAEAVRATGSCMSDNPEGISYYHLAFGVGVDSIRAWFNPTESANPLQIALLRAYARIQSLM